MKIKTLMHFLNESNKSGESDREIRASDDENVIYIENPSLETVSEQLESKEILRGGTNWTDQSMGELLVASGKLRNIDVDQIINFQREKGIYFGEAAVALELVSPDDILKALSSQFGYTYGQGDDELSEEKVMASLPFSERAEEFRSIREQLANNWLNQDQKVLAVVSPDSKEGRSYVAANLAMAFSQTGRSTMLIDANLRSPRQHEIFDNKSSRIGLSMLLAGRLTVDDLDVLPESISTFQYLSVLGCGAVPPNPAELLGNGRFELILQQLKKYYDIIIIDTPPASYKADVMSIAAVAGSALLVTRSGFSKMENTTSLVSMLKQVETNVVGAVLNQF